MPLNVRQQARRKLDQANNQIDWAGKHLADVILTYQDDHPEIADPLRDAATLLAETQNLVKHVKSKI